MRILGYILTLNYMWSSDSVCDLIRLELEQRVMLNIQVEHKQLCILKTPLVFHSKIHQERIK